MGAGRRASGRCAPAGRGVAWLAEKLDGMAGVGVMVGVLMMVSDRGSGASHQASASSRNNTRIFLLATRPLMTRFVLHANLGRTKFGCDSRCRALDLPSQRRVPLDMRDAGLRTTESGSSNLATIAGAC